MIIKKISIENMETSGGGKVPNQFKVFTPDGCYFQSYSSLIAFRPIRGGQVVLDQNKWNYSKTTGKYRNQFLRETKKETEQKIKSGVYILADLN